jgi:stealth protein CR2/Stealth-like protein
MLRRASNDAHIPQVSDISLGERCEVFVRMRRRIAYVIPRATPMRAREINRTLITDALEYAGIAYFVVPGLDDRPSVVAVRADDRSAVAAALTAGLRAVPGYVSEVPRVPGVRERLEFASGSGRAAARLADTDTGADVVRVSRLITDETRSLVSGHEFGCIVEFWHTDGDELFAPRVNKVTDRVPLDFVPVPVAQYRFTRLYSPFGTRPDGIADTVSSLAVFDVAKAGDIEFPIDAVYTWVDGEDPAWARRKAEARGDAYHEESASDARFLSRDELRYSLRSLHLNAPWIRNVYIVTDDQTPAWLTGADPSVRVVDHRKIFARPEDLPTFNSHSIESQLHRIEGLSEHFLYFNDDMFVGRPLAPQTFFTPSGMTKYFPAGARIALGPITEEDRPVDAACKNNRALLQRTFGRVISQPMDHIPYALRRTIMAELETRYPQEYQRTAASRFRAMTDLSVTSSLAHYYGLLTGRAVASSLAYGYVHLAHPELGPRLEQMLRRRDRDAFCLNDAFSTSGDIEAQNALINPFLDGYFPVPCPAEGPVEQQTDEPATALDDLVTTLGEPATALGELVSTLGEPATALGELVSAPDEPATALGEPAMAYGIEPRERTIGGLDHG